MTPGVAAKEILMNRKLRMGMVGGGRDSFIGPVHRMAAQMDSKIELVCGAFSNSPEKSRLSGQDLLLPPERVYGTYEEMLRAEAQLPDGDGMDFVSIVTPNNMHHPVAMAALEAGFHVVCDKPMTLDLDEARELERKVQETGRLFCLTHNYTGYPMVKEARDLVSSDRLGAVRRVVVEYPQGWLATDVETTGLKQAVWRTDPRIAGASSCMGDIGTHCENLAEYITGLRITEMCADLTTFVSGRRLEDDGSVLLRFGDSARGILWASQVAIGQENTLSIRVYGEKGSLEWHQERPNTLVVRWPDRPTEMRRTATNFVGEAASSSTRLPAGHPEGYLEAFANVYSSFADALSGVLWGENSDDAKPDYPDVHDGVRGMAFLDAVVSSAGSEKKWVEVPRYGAS
jgi:predicted dehydrogenase